MKKLDIMVTDIGEDDEGCARLQVNTNEPCPEKGMPRSALLVNAAEDLLAACKVLVENEKLRRRICPYCNTNHAHWPDGRCPVGMAERAIAKAEGAR